VLSISKKSYYYRAVKPLNDGEIKSYLLSLAMEHKRWGFDKMMQKAKNDGKPWNHKRVYRIYCELKLNLRVKPRKRIPKGEAKALVYPIKPNVCWSIDFMTDVLQTGQRFRTLNVIDDYNREALMIEPSYSLPATAVTSLIDKIAMVRGYPNRIRVDNGPEFIANHFKSWAKQRCVTIDFIQPGKPAQNGFIERFNRIFREDILDMYWFNSLLDVRNKARQWMTKYNTQRPHGSLNGLSPIQFAKFRESKTS